MRLRLWGKALIPLLVIGLSAATASAAVGWHTRATAERNILHAPRSLARWNPELVNPQTHLIRTHVTVTCTGLGRGRHARFPRFACVVRFAKLRIHMTYIAQSDHGFELHGRKSTSG
jgi:hypothetical protein